MSEAAFFSFYVAKHGILTKHHGFVIFLYLYLYYWLFYTIFAESYNLKAISKAMILLRELLKLRK